MPGVPQGAGQSSPQSGVGRGPDRFPCGVAESPVLVVWPEGAGELPDAQQGSSADRQPPGQCGRAEVTENQEWHPPLPAGRKRGRWKGPGGRRRASEEVLLPKRPQRSWWGEG